MSVDFHEHNSIDSPTLDPKYFKGFPTILVTDSTVSPTNPAKNGVIIILYDTSHWNLWIRVNNLWKTTSLA